MLSTRDADIVKIFLFFLMESSGPALAHHGGITLYTEWVWNDWSDRLLQHNSASQQQHGNHKTQKYDLEFIKSPVCEI